MDRCFSYNVSSNNRYTYPDICPKRYNAIRTMLSMLNRHCLITHKHCTLDVYCKCTSFNNNKLLKVRWCNKWWCDVSKWTNRFTYFDRNKTPKENWARSLKCSMSLAYSEYKKGALRDQSNKINIVCCSAAMRRRITGLLYSNKLKNVQANRAILNDLAPFSKSFKEVWEHIKINGTWNLRSNNISTQQQTLTCINGQQII